MSKINSYQFLLPVINNKNTLISGVIDEEYDPALLLQSNNTYFLCDDFEQAIILKRILMKKRNAKLYILVGSVESLPVKNNSFHVLSYHDLKLERKKSAMEIKNNIDLIIKDAVKALNSQGEIYISYYTGSWQFIKKYFIINSIEKIFQFSGLLKHITLIHYLDFEKVFFIKPVFKKKSIKNLLLELKNQLFGNTVGGVYYKKGFKKKFVSIINQIIIQAVNTKYSVGKLDKLWVGSTNSTVAEFDNCILRLPSDNESKKYCEVNFQALTVLNSENCITVQTPLPVAAGMYNQYSYYIESKIKGVSLDCNKLQKKHEKIFLKNALNILSELSAVEASHQGISILVKYFSTEIKKLLIIINDEDKEIIHNLEGKIIQKINENNISSIFVHGDFKKSNFIVENLRNPEIIGLIDWEFSEVSGFPLYDLFILLSYDFKQLTDLDKNIIEKFKIIANSNGTKSLIADYMGKLCIPYKMINYLTAGIMIIYINKHYNKKNKLSELEYQKYIRDGLISFCEEFKMLK